MKYADILNEDYTQRLFHQFLYTTAINSRTPTKILQYPVDDYREDCVVFSKTKRGTTVTKTFRLDKVDMLFFLSWFGNEFPDIEFQTTIEED